MNTTKKHIIKEVIKSKNGKFFSVEFTKKDGTPRLMLCRTGVKKYLVPNPQPMKKSEVVQKVYDVHKKAYRSFNFDTVTRIGNVQFIEN